jgi:uncharacterized protein
MPVSFKSAFSLSALSLASALVLAAPSVAGAQDRQPSPRIVVNGEGEATLRPDMALVTLGVMREAATAREALTANSDAMAAVIAAMKAGGIADRDLQTAGLQINPRYTYTNRPDGTQDARLVAYQVSNTLSVRARDLDALGEIIDRSVTLGVNQGGSITFTNDDPKPALTDARKRAVADARQRAETLAVAAGTEIGRVLEISEQNFVPPPQPFMAGRAMARDMAESVPVEAGENAYRVTVTVTYALK